MTQIVGNLVFSYGFKSARLFGRNLYVWDFLLKVVYDFNQSQLSGGGSGSAEVNAAAEDVHQADHQD